MDSLQADSKVSLIQDCILLLFLQKCLAITFHEVPDMSLQSTVDCKLTGICIIL